MRELLQRRENGTHPMNQPPTPAHDDTLAEIEFRRAMHDYKLWSGRAFPTWSEVLEVLRSLGYEKMA
jgi:hypothetical protein